VYTYVGDIVISVNPFKNTGCVGNGIRSKYRGGSRAQLPPHVYMLVDQTFNQMVRNEMSQSVLISGESGAGKTEAMKICLTYISTVAQSMSGGEAAEIAPRLMMTNPIMEGLGNAKTSRNNNSSRFGKHFDIQFNAKGGILGAFTSCYLLEKPRICKHLVGERNYHIFYMIAKSPKEIRDDLGVSKWQDYYILNQKGTVAEVTTWSDEDEMRDCHTALLKLGFTEQARREAYMILTSCMNLGNLTFKPSKEGSDIPDTKKLEGCAKDLQVTADILKNAIVQKTITIPGSTLSKPLEPAQADVARNSLVMHLYQLVFDWCTHMINEYISVDNPEVCIGVLDIFGFENFMDEKGNPNNNFPQMCINFTNESLHNLFIDCVFKLEQEIYIKEEIEWSFESYETNQPIIDLIAKRPVCILGLLDEGCATEAGKDSSVLSNCHQTFTQKKYKGYIKPKKAGDKNFGITHYAGEVIYTMEGFVEKNKDDLSLDITSLLEEHTGFQTLKDLSIKDAKSKADAAASKKGKGKKGKKTVGKAFSESLQNLMDKLRATEHHYIRCIKPNQTLKAGDWDNDFMFKQLGYSGTLEVTKLRKAGLNVRRPLKHFYAYYKMCASNAADLRAGTVTKRCELLLNQLKVNKKEYRVGKTLIFFKSFDIIEAMDKVRESKIVEYVVVLQSFFRMFKDYQFFNKRKKAIARLQGFCKSWEIRRAYVEVRTAAKLIQKYGRTYLAYKKFQEMREGDSTPKEKKKEMLIMILHPERFKGKSTKVAFNGKRRARAFAPVKVAKVETAGPASEDNEPEYAELPQFEVSHEGWLSVRIGRLNKFRSLYVGLKQGTISLYEDHETLVPVLSYNLAACTLEGFSSGVDRSKPYSEQEKPASKPVSSLTLVRKHKLHTENRRNFTDLPAKIKALWWGRGTMTFELPAEAAGSDVLFQWADKFEASLAETKVIDSFKMQVNLDGDEDAKPVNQKVAAVIKEGYMRKKKGGARNQIQESKRGWERRYLKLFNDGKLRYYDNKVSKEEKGCIDLRFFALQEVEEDMEIDDEEEGEERQALKVANQFFKIEKGKQFGLYSGRHIVFLASPEKAVADEWITTLNTTLAILYQKSPIFPQDTIRISLMDGTFHTMEIDEKTKTSEVIKKICMDKKKGGFTEGGLKNVPEWGLIEQWDHPGLPGGMSERKLPHDELLLDTTLLTWEQAARKKYGLVSMVPTTAFQLILRKQTSLLDEERSKKEEQLEFCQALADMREGRFTTSNREEIFELAALAVFKDLHEGMADVEHEEELVLEEGQLTAQLEHYLPAHWFKTLALKGGAVQAQELTNWDAEVVRSFNALTRDDLEDEFTSGKDTSQVRKIVASFRMENDMNAVQSTRMFIERVRLAPLCFSAQYIAEMWSVDKILKVLVVINYGGLHIYRLGENPLLLSTFDYNTLVSWQSMNDMLIINIIYAAKGEVAKRREKLRFLTRESLQMKMLLSKYAKAVLADIVKRMKERERLAQAKARGDDKDDDDDDDDDDEKEKDGDDDE